MTKGDISIMRPIMTINVTTYEAQTVEGGNAKIVMIPFSAETDGALFRGRTTENGTDTQRILPDGTLTLSARYMLSGKDASGNDCRIFIENSGTSLDSCKPVLCTDSPELTFLETADLSSVVEPCPGGVTVTIFMRDGKE